jgi:hypothetical protein
MDKNLKLREVKDSDVKSIVKLHNKTYGMDRTVKHWNWEYKGNYPDNFVYGVIDDKGRIAGTQGMLPININILGKKHFSGKSESSLLDSDYRGGTLFTDIYEYTMSLCKDKKMYCVWGFTSAVKVWRHKLNFEVYENDMTDARIVLNRSATFFMNLKSEIKSFYTSWRTKRTTLRKAMGTVLGKMKGGRGGKGEESSPLPRIDKDIKVSKNYKLENAPRSVKDIELLFKRLRKKYPNLIHMNFDKKYIQWRIKNNPHINYKHYFVYEGDKLRAYCYFNPKHEKRVAYLSDLTFENLGAGKFLLDHLLQELKSQKFAYMNFFGNRSNPMMALVLSLLQSRGAKLTPNSQAFVLRNLLYPDEKVLHNIENWYLNGLWTEGHTM